MVRYVDSKGNPVSKSRIKFNKEFSSRGNYSPGDGGSSSTGQYYTKKVVDGKTILIPSKWKPTGRVYQRTAGGYYSTKMGKSYPTPEAVETAERTAKTSVVSTEKKWYYSPRTRVTSTTPVPGQEAMTKQEALNVVRRMPSETKTEYAKQYSQYTAAKKDVQRAELSALAGPITQREAPTLAEGISYGRPTTNWGPRISNLPKPPSLLGGKDYKESVDKPTVLHTTKRWGITTPIVEITPKWLKDLSTRKEQKAEKQTGISGQTAMFGAAALSGAGTYLSVVTDPFKALKGFGSFIKAGVTDPFGTGAAIGQELQTRPVSFFADIAAYRAGLRTWGKVIKPVTSYVKPEITKLPIPTDKGPKTIYRGFSIMDKPIIGISNGKIKLGTPGGIDLSAASKPFIVESAAATKILLKNMGKQDLILSKQLSGGKSGVSLHSEIKPGGIDLLQRQFEGYKFNIDPSGKSVITTSGQLMPPPELTKLGGLITKTRTVESTPSPYVLDKFLRQTETWNVKELDKILDFTKKYKGDLFGSFAAQHQTRPDIRRIGADVDIMFDMPESEMMLRTAELVKDLTKLGADVKQKGIGIEKYVPSAGQYVHGADIKLKEGTPDISQDAMKDMSDFLKGDKVYGAPLGQPTIKIEDVKVMPLSEQVVRKMGSIATIRPGQPGESWTIAPEAHRMKDVPDWFAGYETLSGKQALDLRKLYPADLFTGTKGMAGKIPLYKYKPKAFSYPSKGYLFGLTQDKKLSSLSKLQDYKLDYKTKYPKKKLLGETYTSYPSKISSETYPSYSSKINSYVSKMVKYPSKAGTYPSKIKPYKYPSSKAPSKSSPYKSPSSKTPSKIPPYKYPPSKTPPYDYKYKKDYYKEYKDKPGKDITKIYYYPKIKQTKFRKEKKKKIKGFKFKYQPSLVAGMERITTKEMPLPIYLTGVGVRPVKRK